MPNQIDDATTQILENVREDVGLLRDAVDRLRPAPNYALTLAEILQRVVTIETQLASEMTAQANDRERSSAADFALARKAEVATRSEPTKPPNAGNDQGWVYWACGIAVVPGALLFFILSGSLTWLLPQRWALADSMAGYTLDAPTWEAGQGLMERARPDPKALAVPKGQSLHIDAAAMAKCREAVLMSGVPRLCKVRITLDPVVSTTPPTGKS